MTQKSVNLRQAGDFLEESLSLLDWRGTEFFALGISSEKQVRSLLSQRLSHLPCRAILPMLQVTSRNGLLTLLIISFKSCVIPTSVKERHQLTGFMPGKIKKEVFCTFILSSTARNPVAPTDWVLMSPSVGGDSLKLLVHDATMTSLPDEMVKSVSYQNFGRVMCNLCESALPATSASTLVRRANILLPRGKVRMLLSPRWWGMARNLVRAIKEQSSRVVVSNLPEDIATKLYLELRGILESPDRLVQKYSYWFDLNHGDYHVGSGFRDKYYLDSNSHDELSPILGVYLRAAIGRATGLRSDELWGPSLDRAGSTLTLKVLQQSQIALY